MIPRPLAPEGRGGDPAISTGGRLEQPTGRPIGPRSVSEPSGNTEASQTGAAPMYRDSVAQPQIGNRPVPCRVAGCRAPG